MLAGHARHWRAVAQRIVVAAAPGPAARPVAKSSPPRAPRLQRLRLALYIAGRVIRTQEHERQPQVLIGRAAAGDEGQLQVLSRIGCEGRAGVATRNRSFETWALSITHTTFLQRRVDFYLRAPPPAAPIESVISSGSYKFLRRTEPEVGSLRFLADQTTRQPGVLNTGGS